MKMLIFGFLIMVVFVVHMYVEDGKLLNGTWIMYVSSAVRIRAKLDE